MCFFFFFLLVVKHHVSLSKETNVEESFLIWTRNILRREVCVCPAVIPCAARTWIDNDPVSVCSRETLLGARQSVLDLLESGCPQLVSSLLLQGSHVL